MASITISTKLTTDNEDNLRTGVPDNDIGVVGNWRHVHSTDVELVIPVSSDNFGQLQAAALEIVAFDIDPTEQDGVWVNANPLANLTTGGNNAFATSTYDVRNVLQQSDNLIQVGNINLTEDTNDKW